MAVRYTHLPLAVPLKSVRKFVLSIAFFACMAMPGSAQRAQIPRMPDGKPNFTGLWEALGTAYWDIRDHSAHAGSFYQLGATGAMILGTAIDELERRRKSTALVTLCIGAGMGTATIIERV